MKLGMGPRQEQMIRYELPKRWILYDTSAVMTALVDRM
jgi:hypothetical protein